MSDKHTGLLLTEPGSLGLSTSGMLGLALNSDSLTSFVPMVLQNSRASQPIGDGSGVLYKKPGSAGLWWLTASGERNLLEPEPRVVVNDGSACEPGMSFQSDHASGLFKSGSSVGLSVNGNPVLSAAVDAVRVPAVDFLRSGGASSANASGRPGIESSGRLTTKPGSAGLWWLGADGSERDLTADPVIPKQEPVNQVSAISGSVLKPSYSFSDDQKTGLYLDKNQDEQSGALRFTVGGAPVVTMLNTALVVDRGNILLGDPESHSIGSLRSERGGLWWSIGDAAPVRLDQPARSETKKEAQEITVGELKLTIDTTSNQITTTDVSGRRRTYICSETLTAG
jgi:uncharacterized protein YbaR (Trm112 family)